MTSTSPPPVEIATSPGRPGTTAARIAAATLPRTRTTTVPPASRSCPATVTHPSGPVTASASSPVVKITTTHDPNRKGRPPVDLSGATILDRYWTDWQCPRCGREDRTPPMPPNSSRMHNCPRMGGLTAPLVWAGFDATTEPVERGDYVGAEHPQCDQDGRPWMAVRTRHATGREDCAVLAPAAIATIHL
jgi:hypothetical protein